MVSESEKDNQKNKISNGLIISKDVLTENPIIPVEVMNEIKDMPYYLLIFISREDVIKISCFPSKTKNIKKVLIKLKEFSPDLVKGISGVLRDLDLSKNILHTTGLCYEMEKCFYETYMKGDSFGSDTIETIKSKFLDILKVINVEIEEISVYKK